MNDDPKSFVALICAALFGIVTFFTRRTVQSWDTRITALEAKQVFSVSRDDLAHTLREMRDDRIRMHQENTDQLRYIRERVDSIIDRQLDSR